MSLGIKPLIGNPIAREKIANRMVDRRPPYPNHTYAVERRLIPLLPALQQVVQHRIELLLRWIPRLVQVIVNLRRVDGSNRCLGIGIGRQQNALRIGIDLHPLLEKVDPGHPRHTLVGEKQRDRVLPLLKLIADIQRSAPGRSADNTVVLPVVAAQVLHHSFQYAGIVVDG